MTKLLLLLAFVVLVIAFLRQSRSARAAARRPPAERAPESMVSCARCGVNQPLSECLLSNGRYYCCDAHRRQAEASE